MKALSALLWAAFLICCSPEPCLAALESLRDGAPVDLDADRLNYDKTSDLWRAEGGVRLQKGGLRFWPTFSNTVPRPARRRRSATSG